MISGGWPTMPGPNHARAGLWLRLQATGQTARFCRMEPGIAVSSV